MITEILPNSAKDMVRMIGLTPTLALIALRGGERLYIPMKYRPNHWIQEVIGMEHFKTLINYYRGEYIEMPRCDRAIRSTNHAGIISESKQGFSNAVLARKYGFTERNIRKIIARSDGNR